MTYDEFKTYIVTNLWRTNDAELIANLDTLITQATSELDQRTRDFHRRTDSTVLLPEVGDFVVSAIVPDFKAVMSLNRVSDGCELTATQYSNVVQYRKAYSDQFFPRYAVSRDGDAHIIHFIGSYSADNPGGFNLLYRNALPDYQTLDSSWLSDDYLNLYLYTVLKHCAIFLREDERLQAYGGLAQEAFEIADQDDKHNLALGGSPLDVQPHRPIP